MADMSELREKLRKGLEGAQSGPYKLDARGSYIWAPSEKGGDFPVGDRIGRDDTGIPVMRLRGWGYYTGNGHGALGLSAAESALEQAVRALTELCDRDNAYLGADILIPCDSHADAIGIMTRARSTLSLLKASRREASS